MKAAAFVSAALMAIGLTGDGAQEAAPSGTRSFTLLYVGAEDCGPCRIWRRDEKPAFLDGIDPDRVRYREVIALRLAQAFEEPNWPSDLRAYRASAERARGVPLWMVIQGDHIVATAGGLSLWRTRVLPLVRREAHRG